LTPAEIGELADGYQERINTQMQLMAWHAANIMNVHLKKKVTVKKLLGKEKTMTQDDREKEFKKLMKLMNQRGWKHG
jgi:hypothetical protein